MHYQNSLLNGIILEIDSQGIKKMRKILFFTDKISLSGSSKVVSWLANNVGIKETKVSLVTYIPMKDQYFIENDVERINLEIQCKSRIKKSLLVVNELRKIYKGQKIDVCISFLPIESLYAILAAIGTKTKVIACERSDPYLERSLPADFARWMFRLAQGAVYQTETARSFYPESLQKKSVVIPNPAFEKDRNDFVAYEGRENVITSVGRLYIKQKRQDVLLKAFKYLVDRGNRTRLIIYGDGPDREILEKQAKEMGIDHFVEFAGNVTSVEEEIRKSQMFVLTSDYEGIPNAIIEALQCGVPVISTDCSPGGARLLIRDGINGFVVPRGNSQAIGEKIEYLLKNKKIALSMAKNAQMITEQFSEQTVIEMWRSYIKTFLVSL